MTATAGFWVHEKTCNATVEPMGDTVFVSFSGTINAHSLRRLMTESQRLMKPPPVYWGVLLDFSGSMLVMDDQTLGKTLVSFNYLGPWCPVAVAAGHQLSRFDYFSDLCASPAVARPARVFLARSDQSHLWLAERQQGYERMQGEGWG